MGEEFGFASAVLRGRVRFVDGTAGTLVAKLPGDEDAEGREERFYREGGAPFAPRFLGAVDRVLLLEDVRGRQGDVLAGCSLDEARAVLEPVMGFHAEHASRDPGFPRWGADPKGRQERYAGRVDPFLERHGEALPAEAVAVVEALRTQLTGLVAELAAGPRTLIHGDLHLDNLLFTAGGPVVLDWQSVGAGPPAWDLALFLSSSLDPDARRAAEDELLTGDALADYARGLLVVFAGFVGWLARPDRAEAGERERAVRRAAIGDGRVVAAVLDHAAGVVRLPS